MVLVQGSARTRRSSPAWIYAKGGDNYVYSRKLTYMVHGCSTVVLTGFTCPAMTVGYTTSKHEQK